MRNYAKWDLLELNKLCCCFFSDKIHLSNTENENDFSAAYHTRQIIMKNGKAWENRRIYINWIWVRDCCDLCVVCTGHITDTVRGPAGPLKPKKRDDPIPFKKTRNHSFSEECKKIKWASLGFWPPVQSQVVCFSLYWILWIQITHLGRKPILILKQLPITRTNGNKVV